MVREATNDPANITDDEAPEFLGRPYNLTVWKQTRAEREFFRNDGPRVGSLAPDFELPAIDGGMVSLESMRGLPVVLELGSMT
ncbi:MAG: hypothetical protein O2826_01790 [Chloroflexi bacterium]|nr:hypothetical protein [Chloroflexota bacterium]MDA1173233.1 hypothetical protein [Chloroflexota bacterium]